MGRPNAQPHWLVPIMVSAVLALIVAWLGVNDWRFPWVQPAISTGTQPRTDQMGQPPTLNGLATSRATSDQPTGTRPGNPGVASPDFGESVAPPAVVPGEAPPAVVRSPGEVRFSFPDVQNATHPNVLRPPSAAPVVRLTPVSAGGANPLLEVGLSGLGLSIIQISMLGPDGREYLKSAELVTSQPEMAFTYSRTLESPGTYSAVVTDLRTGLSARASVDLPKVTNDSSLIGVPIGQRPDLVVTGVTGRACDAKGAILSISARNVTGLEIFTARAPERPGQVMLDHIDYPALADELGQGYIAVAVQAQVCTGEPITGFTLSRGADLLLEFQVPN